VNTSPRTPSTALTPAAPRREEARPLGLSAAVANLGLLLLIHALDAPPGFVASFLLATFAGLAAVVARRYVAAGRLVATPALILFLLMNLYTIPVVVADLSLDYPEYQRLARPALILTEALNGVGVVLLAFDRPGPSPSLARLLERGQWRLCFVSYALLGAGTALFAVNFRSLSEIYSYVFETTYYQKHIFFEGKAYLGLFSLCFELAGLLAAVGLAVPPAAGRWPRALHALALTAVVLATVNHGYRTAIVLIFCMHLVARSFWAGRGSRVTVLALAVGVLAPTFLAWAYVRDHISSAGIFDVRGIAALAANSNWANVQESEIGVTLKNGGHLLALLDCGEWHYQWGATLLLDPLIAVVPRAVWADRPDALQIAFTRAVDPSYAEGGTMSFSFALEGYLNFGVVGAVVWSGLLAYVLVRLGRGAEAAASRGDWVACLLAMVACAPAWFYIRDDFGDLVRRCLILLLLTALAGSLVGLAAGRGRLAPPPSGPDRPEGPCP
jgi:hypothetical protein